MSTEVLLLTDWMIARVHSSQVEQTCRLSVARVKWPVSTALLLVSFISYSKSLAIGHSIIKSKHIIVSTWHEGYGVLARVDGRNTKKLLHKQDSPALRNQSELHFMPHDIVTLIWWSLCLQLCVLQRFQVPRHLSHSRHHPSMGSSSLTASLEFLESRGAKCFSTSNDATTRIANTEQFARVRHLHHKTMSPSNLYNWQLAPITAISA